jgi:cation:H+ antiporter
MPYCSGIGNLIFAFLIAQQNRSGAEVMTNALVNNVTNLTLLVGLPALIWSARPRAGSGKGKGKKSAATPAAELNRLAMLLTLLAVLFFTGATWALGRDGQLSFNDGLVLVGLFLFWQCIHVFEVLKGRARGQQSFTWRVALNLALLGVGAFASYTSIDWLVNWLDTRPAGGFISRDNLGWLSGWMMVLPNALLALYYGWCRKPEVVYTSQVGDAHICIPLCVGISALHQDLKLPDFFELGVWVLGGAVVVHLLFVGLTGRLPRAGGILLVAAYAFFVKAGLF